MRFDSLLTSYLIVLTILVDISLSQEILINATYNRNGKMCKPVFNCKPGNEIVECKRDGEQETCESCPSGYVQPSVISSVLVDEKERKCFRPQDQKCSKKNAVPARKLPIGLHCTPYCQCDNTRCYHGRTSCQCNLKEAGCPPNRYLNTSGACVDCPDLTHKIGDGCGPCRYNTTRFRERVHLLSQPPSTPLKTFGSSLSTHPVIVKRRNSSSETNPTSRTERDEVVNDVIIVLAVLCACVPVLGISVFSWLRRRRANTGHVRSESGYATGECSCTNCGEVPQIKFLGVITDHTANGLQAKPTEHDEETHLKLPFIYNGNRRHKVY